ncbi:MAG: cysteine desulfurase [Chloroflexi bacterium]|jgi:cysteine desulfurase|nr:cysteine desulfurase [Chloroflexota bacterium]
MSRDAAGIYLDYNASTPIDPRVAAVMRRLLGGPFANPSALHPGGREARAIVDGARGRVADLLGAAAEEIVFTSGGSEANNAALVGAWFARPDGTEGIVTTAVEHPAILEPARFLERLGATVTRVPVDRFGRVDPDDVRRALTARTFVVSVMHANNEVGTVEPIAEIGAIAREAGVLFHTDAAQTIGKIPTRVDDLGVDLLSIAGHKAYAPKGIGALYVRRGVRLEPLVHGAGHESGRRAGTESALLDAALGEAACLAADLAPMEGVRAMRDRLWDGLRALFGDDVVLNGHPVERLPNTLNVSFVGRPGADVLAAVGDVAASTGSACHADSIELSPVLAAMGVEPRVGMGAVRLSLGRMTVAADIDGALERFGRLAAEGRIGASHR